MKRFLLPLILILTFSSLNAQQDITKFLTSGKWYVASIQEKGEKPEEAENKNDEWIVFQEEGKVEESYFGDAVTCEWKYSKKLNIIEIFDNSEVKFFKIIEATKDKLVVEVLKDLKVTDESTMVTYIK